MVHRSPSSEHEARGVSTTTDPVLGEFWLGSDAVMQTFTLWPNIHHITGQLSSLRNEKFYALGYTIGASMVYPR